ncbi:MAG: 16S rRNA methyltransferase [Thermoplasmata archaeon]|nr:MAG: 16S rRNA methyltransferase [Thermoplasmata archaeon]
MLTLILAETEIELIPKEIIHHPAVISSAQRRRKKPEKIILDSNYHHNAMKKLFEGERRGRPDILHIFLLTTLESILNKEGKLHIKIHTRNDEEINISPETRIMRNYDRFIGLIEQLFEKETLPGIEKPLLRLKHNISLRQIIKQIQPDITIAFSTQGKKTSLPNYFMNLKNKGHRNIACIIGGFPYGEFHSNIEKIVDDVISIYNTTLSAWTIANEIIVNYENTLLVTQN